MCLADSFRKSIPGSRASVLVVAAAVVSVIMSAALLELEDQIFLFGLSKLLQIT